MTKSLIAAAALLALAGCATPFNAKVSRFQQLPPTTGQSFVIQASNPKLQGGLEFGQYAQIVTANSLSVGQLADADETRRVLSIPPAERSAGDWAHLAATIPPPPPSPPEVKP